MLDNLFSSETLQRILLMAPGLLLGVSLHEAAHGYIAYRFGDPTAKMLGRLTINPIKHIDAMGTLCFVLTAAFTPFAFGWAKPVPVDPRYFKNIRVGMRWVSLAGPAANFLLAILFALALKIVMPMTASSFTMTLATILQFGVLINVVLMVLNLLPIPPLDGGQLLISLLPPKQAMALERVAPWGMFILMGLLILGLLGKVIGPIVWSITRALIPGIG